MSLRTHAWTPESLQTPIFGPRISRRDPPSTTASYLAAASGLSGNFGSTATSSITIPEVKLPVDTARSNTSSETTLGRPFAPSPVFDPPHEDDNERRRALSPSALMPGSEDRPQRSHSASSLVSEHVVLPGTHKPYNSVSSASTKARSRGRHSREPSYTVFTPDTARYFLGNAGRSQNPLISASNPRGGYRGGYGRPDRSHTSSLSHGTAPTTQEISGYPTSGSSHTSHYPETPFTGVPSELGPEFSSAQYFQTIDINTQQDNQPQFRWSDGTISSFGTYRSDLLAGSF